MALKFFKKINTTIKELYQTQENVEKVLKPILNSAIVDGVLIKDSNIREEFDIMIVGIIKETGESIINPSPDTILSNKYTILLMGESDKMDRFKAELPS